MKSKWAGIVIALAVTALVSGLSVLGQTTGGSLEGKIVDQAGKPIPGVLIQVAGTNVQGYLGTATDSGGQYFIGFLPAGRGYEVRAEAQGYATVVRKGIEVPLNTTVSLPFVLGEGKTEVEVTAGASMIDPRTTKGGDTLSDKMLMAIPLQRDANQIVFLAPGATDGGTSTPGMASILGSTGAENAYLVNGVDVTNTDYGTGTGATGCIPCTQSGPVVVAGVQMGSMLNFDFIQDQQVMAGGVSPEYGWATGGVVNSITKSGGNEFHGGLFAYYWSDALQAESKTYPYDSSYEGNGGYTRYDVGGSLSGYFVKDRLWFYLGYDYNRMTQYTDVPGGPGYGDPYLYLNGHPAQSAYAGRRIRDTSEINQQYAFSLTWNASPDHKLSLVVFGNQDKTDRLRTVSSLAPESMSSSEKTQPTSVSLQWNATWTPRFFTEAVAAYRSSTQKTTLTPEGYSNLSYQYYFSSFYALPKDQFTPPVASAGIAIDLGHNVQPSLGYGGYVGIDEDTSWQARFKGTNLFGAAGRHELSYGLQYDDRRYTPLYGTSGPTDFVSPGLGRVATGGLYTVLWYPAALFGYPTGPDGQQYIYRVDEGFSGQTAPTAMRTWSAWANDNWSLTDYFTLKLGLRYDEERVEGRLPGGQTLDLTGNYAPRLGFTWDVAHNSKSKLFGFAGRYYQRVPTEIGVRALNSYASGREWFYDPQLTILQRPSVFFGALKVAIQGQTPGLPVESSLKAPYTDEALLGFDYEVLPDLRVGARAIYRALGRTIDDLSFDLGQTYVIANPGDWTHIPTPGTNGGTYYIAKPIRIYRALEITLDKRWSHNWQLGASYVLSRLEGNYEGGVVNDVPHPALLPNIGPTYDIPETMVNTYGPLPLDRTHVLKVYGSYQFSSIPLLLSGNFLLQSGTPISRHMDYGWYDTTGFAQPRGSSGRTPTTWKLDLGVEYAFWLPKKNYLGLRLDVFNVTNNQATTGVYQEWQYQDSPGGPVVMNNAIWSKPFSHQAPRTARFALRWVF